jgi:hypothetical protein
MAELIEELKRRNCRVAGGRSHAGCTGPVCVPDVAQPIDTPAESVAANEYSTQVPNEAAEAAADGNRRSIAVLPCANRGTREEDRFFVNGMHDDLLTQLAKIGSLKVISRTSVME